MTIPVLWTNDDISVGLADKLQTQLDFLDRHEIPGVFFVVPATGDGKTIDQDADLLRVIEASRKNGHEYFQHGYVHTPFECGVPDTWMLQFAPDVMQQFDDQRLEIERGHTLEAQIEMLEKGQAIWVKAFGERSAGFRPGWGARCLNFHRAITLLGYDWISSTIPGKTSWLYAQEKWDTPLEFREAMPTRPYYIEGTLEIPFAGDFAFHIPNDPEKIDKMVQLGLDEFQMYVDRDDPMPIVSHWHGLEHPSSQGSDDKTHSGYVIHEKLIPAIKATGQAEFMSQSQLMDLLKAS